MRIVIADDHGIFRQGLKFLIEKQAQMEVVGEAEDGRAVVQLVRQLHPDIVIMDICMPNLNGVQATQLILRDSPSTKVIALSMYYKKHFVVEMLRAGALAYVLKSYLFDELIRAINTVTLGEHYLSPQITDILVDDYVAGGLTAEASPPAKLSPRECQILQLVAEGRSTKEIARALSISPKTADANRRQIMEKLGLHSIAELTKYAIREGFTSLEF